MDLEELGWNLIKLMIIVGLLVISLHFILKRDNPIKIENYKYKYSTVTQGGTKKFYLNDGKDEV